LGICRVGLLPEDGNTFLLLSGLSIDLDKKRHVVGIEILDASKKLTSRDMTNITIENLPLEKAA
jgi:hypothetical protein